MTIGEQPATWADMDWGPWPETAVLPQEALTADEREGGGLPASLDVVRGEGIVQRPVFDPALKQYAKAVRAGEPQFPSPDTAARWYDARRRALEHALAAVATSRWAAHLVLRGSVLLQAWYGEAAREPGDLDFVVVPPTWALTEPRTERMLDDLAAAAEAAAARDGVVRIDAAGALRDEIWTYDRVPGRRLVLPWHADGLPSGTVQLDFVFNERLPVDPEFTNVPAWGSAAEHRILAATPELSLAWKLMWLLSDAYPQGKDLYDAVLLAESTPLRATLLMETLAAVQTTWAGTRLGPTEFEAIDVDPEEFRKDHPEIPDSVTRLLERLTAALAPTFAESAALPSADGYTWRARLLVPHTEACRELARAGGMEAVQQWLRDQGFGSEEAVVVTREVAGTDRCTLDDAAATYVEYQRRLAGPRNYYWRNPQDVAEKAVAALRATV